MELFGKHTGMWAGTNRFRLRPDDEPGQGDATGHLTVGAGGNVAALAYTWTHPEDGAQDGVLTFGLGAEPGVVLALWGDSWHQKPGVVQLRGTIDGDSVTVGYEYAEGWWWWITVRAESPDLLVWRMDNVVPPSASGAAEPVKYWAMRAELHTA